MALISNSSHLLTRTLKKAGSS